MRLRLRAAHARHMIVIAVVFGTLLDIAVRFALVAAALWLLLGAATAAPAPLPRRARPCKVAGGASYVGRWEVQGHWHVSLDAGGGYYALCRDRRSAWVGTWAAAGSGGDARVTVAERLAGCDGPPSHWEFRASDMRPIPWGGASAGSVVRE